MRIGELFAGIGGLGLGLERSGLGPVVWQVEQNEYARRVLEKHWPNARRYNDVREVGAHNLEPVGILAGGFPCTDISNAGRREGIEGEQSGLWREFARIIREIRPRYVVVENVPALTARGLGVVLGDLAKCGYDAVWDCISAASVGAPHIRDRLFIVAHANSARLEEREKLGRVVQPKRSPSFRACGTWGREWWEVEPNVGRVAHGVPSRMDRLRCLGNAVVPQVSEVIGGVINQLEKTCQSTR